MKIFNNIKKLLLFCLTTTTLFLLIDYYVFAQEAKLYLPHDKIFYHYYKFLTRDISPTTIQKYIIEGKNINFNKPLNLSGKESPIILFGCSFVYGHKISKSKTLHQVLSKYTSRPIYDRSFSGWGVNQMLYQLKNETFYQKVPQPKYVLYNYIPDHIRRMYTPCLYTIYKYHGAHYKLVEKNNQKYLIPRKTNFFYERFNIVTRLYDYFYINFNRNSEKQFLLLHFLEAKKAADKHWKNYKFIILEYYSDKIFDSIKPELKKNGFIIINRNDLVEFQPNDTRYCLSKIDEHPNEKAWEDIVPKLIKYLK